MKTWLLIVALALVVPQVAQAKPTEPDKCKAMVESVADVVQASLGYAGEATERLMAFKPATSREHLYSEVQIKEVRDWLAGFSAFFKLQIQGRLPEKNGGFRGIDAEIMKILILVGCTDLAKTYKKGRLPPLAQAKPAEPDKCKALIESVGTLVQVSIRTSGNSLAFIVFYTSDPSRRELLFSKVQIKEISEWIVGTTDLLKLHIQGKSHEIPLVIPPMKKTLILAGCTDLAKTYKEASRGPAKK